MNHQQFLDAIAAAPGDVSLRLQYADWLEEHGNLLCNEWRKGLESVLLCREPDCRVNAGMGNGFNNSLGNGDGWGDGGGYDFGDGYGNGNGFGYGYVSDYGDGGGGGFGFGDGDGKGDGYDAFLS